MARLKEYCNPAQKRYREVISKLFCSPIKLKMWSFRESFILLHDLYASMWPINDVIVFETVGLLPMPSEI